MAAARSALETPGEPAATAVLCATATKMLVARGLFAGDVSKDPFAPLPAVDLDADDSLIVQLVYKSV